MRDIMVSSRQIWNSSFTKDLSRYKGYSFILCIKVIMSTKPTLEVYLSNSLFWQGYHGWVTFRFPMFFLPFSKLFWYGNEQLYTYLPVIIIMGFCPQGLQRLLKYLLTSFLLILLSGGGIGLILVFIYVLIFL